MTKKVPPVGQKMNFGKNQLHEVDQRAMPIGKMVLLLILPFGNPKSANGRHPYLRKLFPFFITAQTAKMADFMVQNMAYRATVYRTGMKFKKKSDFL